MIKYIILIFSLILGVMPFNYCMASTPYGTDIGMPWWAILLIVLAVAGTISLTIYLIIDKIKK